VEAAAAWREISHGARFSATADFAYGGGDVRVQPPPGSTVVAAYEGATFGEQGSRGHDAALAREE
jgi:hypothetical protein